MYPVLKKITKLFNFPLRAKGFSRISKPDNKLVAQSLVHQENTPECEYLPDGWKPRKTDRKGWDNDEMVEHYKKNWPPYMARLQGSGPIDFAPGDPNSSSLVHQNTTLVFGYAAALAASGKTKISVLDWGGAVGHYFLLTKALLPGVDIEYHCKDMLAVVAFARGLLPEVNFYSDDSCLNRRYDFVLVSGSLQFSEDWQKLFADLANATTNYILVTRIPIVENSPSFVFAHLTNLYGYEAEFLAWCWNRKDFLAYAQSLNLELVREFLVGSSQQIKGAPEQPVYYGFLFKQRN